MKTSTPTVRVKHIKLDPEDYRDLVDRANLADGVTRCVGGRIVASGYCCPHCDSIQPTGGEGICHETNRCGPFTPDHEVPTGYTKLR